MCMARYYLKYQNRCANALDAWTWPTDVYTCWHLLRLESSLLHLSKWAYAVQETRIPPAVLACGAWAATCCCWS